MCLRARRAADFAGLALEAAIADGVANRVPCARLIGIALLGFQARNSLALAALGTFVVAPAVILAARC